jgi:arylsulfatase
MRYKNFKVLTHKIEDGTAPIQQLAIPHVYNLTVNPDEEAPTGPEQCDVSACLTDMMAKARRVPE